MPSFTPPPSGTAVTFGGVAADCPGAVVPAELVPFTRRGAPSFRFQVRGGPLAGLPDPYLEKEVRVYVNGTLRFVGDVVSADPAYRGGLGWVRSYLALGLRNRGDRARHYDPNDGGASSAYNQAPDNNAGSYLASRLGRSVGQILTDVLLSPANAQALAGYGVGNYTGLPSAPALPSATVADLAALSVVPPTGVTAGGESLLSGTEAFLAQWGPNFVQHVEPDGTLRFLDTRTYANHTFTLDVDPVRPTELSRDTNGSYSRVQVQGQQLAEMYLFSTKNGTLSESPFAHDGLTVAQAKAAWKLGDYQNPGALDSGACSCTSTTGLTLTTAVGFTATADFWDQTASGKHGLLMLTYTAGTTITTIAARAIVANTATSGGTYTVTVDRPLPHLLFDKYEIRGTHNAASSVWCEYALPGWAGPHVAPQSWAPYPYRFAGADGLSTTSTPLGAVESSPSGNPPYVEEIVGVSVDAGAGTVRFAMPTWLAAGYKPPADVRALVPVYTQALLATYPPDVSGAPAYSGELSSVEGVSRTKYVPCPGWRDPANQAAMDAYAQDLWDSLQRPVVEGQVEYLGLFEAALSPGLAVSVAGPSYTTGWESAALPVLESRLVWNTSGGATAHTTVLGCSSRRAHYSDAAYLRPDRTFEVSWEGAFSAADWAGAGAADSEAFAEGVANTLGRAAGFSPTAPRTFSTDGPPASPGPVGFGDFGLDPFAGLDSFGPRQISQQDQVAKDRAAGASDARWQADADRWSQSTPFDPLDGVGD